VKQLTRIAVATAVLAFVCLAHGQDRPGANRSNEVRPIPPSGKELAPADRAELEAGVAAFGRQVDALRRELIDNPDGLALLPDVQVYHNAVRYPLVYNEPLDVAQARAALAEGLRRAASLRAGKADWVNIFGPRGYVSRIDGSVQPYILIVPDGYSPGEAKARRLDFFCHGRDENLTELKFISAKVSASPGERFLVNLYGRYCNANKFAGEIDLPETLESVRRRYPIDDNRVIVTGFSMGGASCWQFAVHYTDLFAAASPGAGFAETPRYLKLPNGGADAPWYERKLWHLYDCTDYAANLFNLPTIAYAGELDPQKQASDVMEAAMKAEGLTLERLTGPGTKHEYHKETKRELDRRLSEYAAHGRNPVPPKARFTTWTLRYNQMYWVTVDAMDRHWERARVDAELADGSIKATTHNVSALSFSFPASGGPFAPGSQPAVMIDGSRVMTPRVSQDQPWTVHLARGDSGWRVGEPAGSEPLRKRHGLQGPIDDAFLDSFTFVLPTGQPLNEKAGRWVAAESEHAIAHWRKQFRGEAKVKRDAEITDADIADSNLVLWGDPASNQVMARVIERLPVRWSAETVEVGKDRFVAGHHVPVLIYPNPLNPKRYVVINSGFTFREADHRSNARQVPKLPDYAVIDIDIPISPRAPGGIVKAGFFGERWELLPDDGRADDRGATGVLPRSDAAGADRAAALAVVDAYQRTLDQRPAWLMECSTRFSVEHGNVQGPDRVGGGFFNCTYIRDGGKADLRVVTGDEWTGPPNRRKAVGPAKGRESRWRGVLNGWGLSYEVPPDGKPAGFAMFCADGHQFAAKVIPAQKGLEAFEGFIAEDPSSLVDILRAAPVLRRSEGREAVDGVSCLRVDAQSPEHGKYTVWFDPAAGHYPRKMVVEKTGASLWWRKPLKEWTNFMPRGSDGPTGAKVFTYTMDAAKLENVGGTWVPLSCRVTAVQHYADGNVKTVTLACGRTKLDLNPDLQRLGAFKPDLREGARLLDELDREHPYEWRGAKPVPVAGKP
jgi:dienelactone hydrolase